jgi:hypothetical protein
MNWRTARRIVCACTIAASAVSVGLWTAQASARTPYLPQAAASANADVDPAAVKELEKMGGYLRTLKAFQVQSVTSRDSVLEDGQQIAFGGTVDMLVQRRPDRLRAEVTSDLQQRLYLYDGASFNLFARRVGYYATIPAPPNLGELTDMLDARYGLEVPLVDLFYWGSERNRTSDLTSAIDVGPSQVNDVTCEHFAFRQDGVDWQVWIQQGDFPLPRKLIITTTSDDARPQFSSVMTWNLAPSYNDAAFTFNPPADAQRITFAESAALGK